MNRQPMVNQAWIFDTHFLNNEQKHVTSRKISDSIFVNDKIWAFNWKLEFWKTCISPWGLESFQILKYFTDKIGCNVKNMAFCCCVMKCVKHLDLHNSVNRYLSNACYKNHVWIQDPCKVQDRPINFME